MKNTYNVGLLRRRIQDALTRPLSDLGTASIEAFLALPGASAWRPERLGLKELSYIFDIGLPFALIGDEPSANWHRLRVGEVVRFGAYPDEGEFRAVHAAALLRRWGADVHFVVDTRAQACGLDLQLPSGAVLDVEVVRTNADSTATERRRSYVTAVDARYGRGAGDADLRADIGCSPQRSGVVLFEPRFWIGIQQKEWIHSARLNPEASVPVPSAWLGNADGNRRALRIPLLT